MNTLKSSANMGVSYVSFLVASQWIKSRDEHGQTYYYLRDGSKSQWNLPEVRPLP